MRELAHLNEVFSWSHCLLVVAVCCFFWLHFPWGESDQQNSLSLTGKANIVDDERDFLKKMDENDKNCIVFFGSQTGTAEGLAARLAKEGKNRFGLKTMIADLEHYDYNNLDQVTENKIVIFVLATYGEGEATDNATSFYEFITSDEPSFTGVNPLDNLNYAAFGLGNHTYEHFNLVVRKVTKSLDALGASVIGPVGEGDEGASSTEDDFMAWKESLWTALADKMNLHEMQGTTELSFTITERPDLHPDSPQVYLGEPNERWRLNGGRATGGPFDHLNPYAAPVTASRELISTTKDSRHCLHLDLDISDTGLKYETGDHLAVWPSNNNIEVDRLLYVLDLTHKRHQVIQVETNDSFVKAHFPIPTTYDAIFRYYLEICAPVSRQLISELVPFAPNGVDRGELYEISQDKYMFHAESHFLNLGQFLQSVSNGLKWPKIPIALILESLPCMQQRFYSISSSPLLQPTQVSITVAVKSEIIADRKMGGRFYGVASNFLLALHRANFEKGALLKADDEDSLYDVNGPRGCYYAERVPIHIRSSKFRLPDDPPRPMIMIGPGTGVAPFRGFVQERTAMARNGRTIGKMLLFFGCRRKDEDYLYEQEWKASQTNPIKSS
ncbi:nadph-cytochrome p450 reductase [Fusarium langsethiae]|uniref:NADPH--hemoprotein reductase n=1 Tax=Fusarium langsethiae TaxID=179993 RepID=A0A0M9ESU2_FUSLA|nr:nadph-cytochrome p450 reductase [Fusarium langsethiae]GKU05536.1 unnamed protein product [Fusarium langsethiae]